MTDHSSEVNSHKLLTSYFIKLLKLDSENWNKKALKAIIEDCVCPTDFKSLHFKVKKSWCDESRYDRNISQLELCRRCWFDALKCKDRGGFDDETD